METALSRPQYVKGFCQKFSKAFSLPVKKPRKISRKKQIPSDERYV
jgi:hypothetical protein